jgi:hypothetical protein
MAQVNGFNFQSTPQNLAAINNVRPDYMPDVWDWQQRAQQHDNTGLADVMRAAQHEAAMDPGRIQKQAADLESVMAQTAGTKLDNTRKGMDNELQQHLLPQKKIQDFKDLILKGTEADEKMAQIEIDKMLRSNDPKVKSYGQQLLDASRKAVEERRKAALDWKYKSKEIGATQAGANAQQAARFVHEKEMEGLRTAKAVKVAEISAAARKSASSNGADPKKWQETANKLFAELRAEQDPEIRQRLSEELQFAQAMAERLAPVAPPQIDPSKVGDGKLVPGRAPMPQAPGTGPKLGTKENPIKLD